MSLNSEDDALYEKYAAEALEEVQPKQLPMDSSLESMVLNLKDAYETQSQSIAALDIILSQHKEEINIWEERLLFKNQEKKNVERELIWFMNDMQQIEKQILEATKKVDNEIELKQDEHNKLKKLKSDYQCDKLLVSRYNKKIERFEEKLRMYKEKSVTSAKVEEVLALLKAEEDKCDLLKEDMAKLSEEDARLKSRQGDLTSEVSHLQQQVEKEKIQREEETKIGARSNAAKVEQLKRKLHQMQSYHGALKKQLRGLANRIGQGYKAER